MKLKGSVTFTNASHLSPTPFILGSKNQQMFISFNHTHPSSISTYYQTLYKSYYLFRSAPNDYELKVHRLFYSD